MPPRKQARRRPSSARASKRTTTRPRTAAKRATKAAKRGAKTAAKRTHAAARKTVNARTTTARRSTGRGSRRDAVALLIQDHREVRDLFRRYRKLGAGARKSKGMIVRQIVRELSVHAAVEEELLYPTVRDEVRGGDRLANEGIDEHRTAKELLLTLDRMDPDDGDFDATMRELMRDVEHHIREEEGEMFPRLRKAMDRETLEGLADMMRAAKKTAPTRPHPHAPSRPPANVVAGLAAGVIDRARDAGRAIVDKIGR